ncbi:MAG: LysR family transcriptional regulator, partial [Rhizobiaceae bacterium]|nr:LysR family transcriptional regulator [Rhizobiaceae bacterium]
LPGVELRIIATEAVSDFERDQVDIAVRLTRPPFPGSVEACLLFRQELVAVASPHLVGTAVLPLSMEQLGDMPLLHDAQDHWPKFFGTTRKLPGAVFNQTSHALDATVAGQGVALACRAFVQADLDAGRLVQVRPAGFEARADYYLARKRATSSRRMVDAVWDWCIANWSC